MPSYLNLELVELVAERKARQKRPISRGQQRANERLIETTIKRHILDGCHSIGIIIHRHCTPHVHEQEGKNEASSIVSPLIKCC